MSNTVIKVENISKQYRLGQVSTGTISHDLNRWWHRVRGKEDPYLKIGEANDRTVAGSSDYVWALRDINFEVQQGEVLGIIGRNGAGKSTLLKILSRTTAPTTGSIKIKGRVASLLEVGTGFHPELSGRENIFLNGAILGMTKKEIARKFDEIVDFAGVERYIDTPVKRYSSGMYVRLAFAVAAHLEPEILIVDEVLAVGDAEFQNKCLGKMKDVSEREGRTVLFVSHNMSAISQLCQKSLLMKNGRIDEICDTDKAINKYLLNTNSDSVHVDFAKQDRRSNGNGKVTIESIRIFNYTESSNTRVFSIGDSIGFSIRIKFKNPNQEFTKAALEIKRADGLKLANMIDSDSMFKVSGNSGQTNEYNVILSDVRFYPDTYFVSVFVGDMSSVETYDYIEDCLSFEIIDGGLLTARPLPRSAGILFLTPKWQKNN